MHDALTRFTPVVEGRKAKGMKDMLSLFSELSKSEKYTADEKPACYAALVAAVAQTATPKEAQKVLEMIRKHNAMRHVPADQKETVHARLVRLALSSAAPRDGETQNRILSALIQAGVAGDRGEAFSLAICSQMSYVDLDTIAEATYQANPTLH